MNPQPIDPKEVPVFSETRQQRRAAKRLEQDRVFRKRCNALVDAKTLELNANEKKRVEAKLSKKTTKERYYEANALGKGQVS